MKKVLSIEQARCVMKSLPSSLFKHSLNPKAIIPLVFIDEPSLF